jgi:hypothetical protein
MQDEPLLGLLLVRLVSRLAFIAFARSGAHLKMNPHLQANSHVRAKKQTGLELRITNENWC